MRNYIALLALSCATPAAAKPIAFQNGVTMMAEYGAGTMLETQAFYAPQYWYSVGAGYLRLEDEDRTFTRDIPYARANLLVKRWNTPGAQANVFAYGGLGAARGSDFEGTELATNAGLQFDAESLRWYGSAKVDWQRSDEFDHRIDTAQLGIAPYKHDYNKLATWVVLQGRHYTGGLYDGIEAAVLLRFFRGPLWVEAGVTNDGYPQAMVMFNY
ncbi:MAG TPA: hypothetical protein VM240_00160 [Verrucomicrobiae bacterium]|nr:hypothetical protein [Verrucomicrobiae bacterium]